MSSNRPSSHKKRKTSSSVSSAERRRKTKREEEEHTEGADDAMTATFQVKRSDPAVDPVLCSFPGGLPAAFSSSASSSSPEHATLPQFILKRHQVTTSNGSSRKPQRNQRIVLIGKDHACRYVGSSPIQETGNNHQRPFQTAVAIYDKQTGQVTLQPTAQRGFIYALQQSVPTYVQKKKEEAAAAANTPPANTTAQLVADFGSAQKQRVMKSQQANRVNVESVVGAGHVGSLLANMSASNQQAVANSQRNQSNGDSVASSTITPNSNTAAEAANRSWRLTSLPPFDENADHPAKIYPVSTMVTPAVWQRLLQQAKAAVRADADPYKVLNLSKTDTYVDEKEEWYPSVQRLLRILIANRNSSQPPSSPLPVVHRMAAALLLQHFLHLYKQLHGRRYIPPLPEDHIITAAAGHDQRRWFFGTPPDVAQIWMDQFTTVDHFQSNNRRGHDNMDDTEDVKVGHVVSRGQADSCKFYLFILNMVAESPMAASTNIKPLADDMHLDIEDAIRLVREVGAKIERKTPQQITAALKVPLTFPPSGRRGRAKRR